MGKTSSSSCLKIMVCGSASSTDSTNNDDDTLSQKGLSKKREKVRLIQRCFLKAKPSSDKRGWSFRKRSGRQRVLGNNVSSETTTLTYKEAPQTANIEIQSPIKSAIINEKPQLPKPIEEVSKPVVHTENYSGPKPSMEVVTPEKDATYVELKASQDEHALESNSNETSAEYKMVDVAVGPDNESNETSDESSLANESFVSKEESIGSAEPKISDSEKVPENVHDIGVSIDEPMAIIIQTAMRRFLAQKEFMRLKSAVKIQAVVRGHLVRRNAVATLHCIRAIVKFQALVRSRSSKSLKNKPDSAQFSTVKLLQNSFTRQLLESTSKPKSLNVKCDPLVPNSAWSWLERWMAVSTSEADKNLELNVEPEVEDENEVQKITKHADDELSSTSHESIALPETIDSNFNVKDGKFMGHEENSVVNCISTVDSSTADPPSIDVMNEQSNPQKQEVDNEDVPFALADADTIEVSHAQVERTFLEDKIDLPATGPTGTKQPKPAPTVSEPIEIEQPKLSTKRSATAELNGEGKKFIYGSRKSSNPAFIAAQSKFEEMTSSSNPERGAVSPSYEENVKKTNAFNDVESSATFNPRIHVAASECGTELSISSTLDSPDRSEIEKIELRQEVQFTEESSCQPDVDVNQGCNVTGMSSSSLNDVPSTGIVDGEIGETESLTIDPVASEVSPLVEQKLEMKTSDVENDIVPESLVTHLDSSPVAVDQKRHENGYKSSPEASAISHRTVPESQETPSSQASVKGKSKKTDKHGSHKKRSSPSAEKKPSSSPNVNSGARSSTENLPKDHKGGKRRNSFGSTKSDNADQEPRDTSSRCTLPSYMQATESARAKANSPRSSPDVHDKEVYSKKRHSLPGATSKQSSPPVHRSTPQPAQGTKANGSHPTNERKWLR